MEYILNNKLIALLYIMMIILSFMTFFLFVDILKKLKKNKNKHPFFNDEYEELKEEIYFYTIMPFTIYGTFIALPLLLIIEYRINKFIEKENQRIEISNYLKEKYLEEKINKEITIIIKS